MENNPTKNVILPESESNIPLRTNYGATIEHAYVVREMKVYGVFENEIDNVASFNMQATVFFSLFSACFSLAVGIWINACFAESLTPAGEVLSKFAAPGLMVFSIIFGVLGIFFYIKKTSIWNRIKAESMSPKTRPIPDTQDSSS